jgi:hypothetical protein
MALFLCLLMIFENQRKDIFLAQNLVNAVLLKILFAQWNKIIKSLLIKTFTRKLNLIKKILTLNEENTPLILKILNRFFRFNINLFDLVLVNFTAQSQ